MKALGRRGALGVVFLAFCIAAPAAAQENIDAGKTPAQLYAQDCAICHKTPHGLSKTGGVFGLQGFLREHYTASRELAAAIAAYLTAIDRKEPPRKRARGRRATPRAEKAKKAGARLPPGKPPEAKAAAKTAPKPGAKEAAKPKAAATPATKPDEAKAAPAPKPVEAKAEAKATGAKTGGAKTGDTKTSGAKAAGAKPEKKTD